MARRNIRERNILFLCQDNSCTSQMAEAIARRLAPPQTRIFSAGITPREIHPSVPEVMKEIQVEMADQRPKGLEAIPIDEMDLVVAFGEASGNCPTLPPKVRLEHWSIPEPRPLTGEEKGMQLFLRYVRDEIDRKVAALFLDHWRNLAH
ncbi:MAG TPA: arsenate reductase ArsC [Candidatus Binatia bacterium]|jgi:arsenate reductase|nr:arsenate reductase ArsC [Candidatus Binatia bacterium]